MADKPSKETTKEAKSARKPLDYTKLNTLSVVSIALAVGWVGSVAAVITGHVALAQIKRSGQRGRRLAIAGLILGYFYIALSLLWGAFAVGMAMRGIILHQGPFGYYGDADMMHRFDGPNGLNGGMMMDPNDMRGFSGDQNLPTP